MDFLLTRTEAAQVCQCDEKTIRRRVGPTRGGITLAQLMGAGLKPDPVLTRRLIRETINYHVEILSAFGYRPTNVSFTATPAPVAPSVKPQALSDESPKPLREHAEPPARPIIMPARGEVGDAGVISTRKAAEIGEAHGLIFDTVRDWRIWKDPATRVDKETIIKNLIARSHKPITPCGDPSCFCVAVYKQDD